MTHTADRIRLAAPVPKGKSSNSAKIIEDLRQGKVEVRADLLSTLLQRGAIDDQWADDLAALKSLKPDISATFNEPFSQRSLHLFASRANGLMLEVGTAGAVEFRRNIAVSTFVGELLGPFYTPLMAPASPLNTTLTGKGIAALAGFVDLTRRVTMASLLNGEAIDGICFTKKDIADEFKRVRQARDNRRLTAIATQLGVDRALTKALPKGLLELEANELAIQLTAPKGAYVPLANMHDLAGRLFNPSPSVVIKCPRLDSNCLYALVGGWSLFRIAATGEKGDSDSFNVGLIDGDEATAELVRLVATGCGYETETPDKSAAVEAKPQSRKPEPDPVQKGSFCKQCGAELQPSQKFCTKCGAKR